MAKENTSKRSRIFLDPLLKANPLFVMVLGTCPALAVTTSFESAIGMGLLFTFVVFFSNLLISALRKVIPEEVETPAYIVIIATFVTIVKILTSTFLPELYNSLGVFVSLLVVNCIVLGRAEAFANKNGVVDSMLDGLGNGLGYTWAIAVIAKSSAPEPSPLAKPLPSFPKSPSPSWADSRERISPLPSRYLNPLLVASWCLDSLLRFLPRSITTRSTKPKRR